ncbi:MAG TPA: PLP-dependent aminotransferase family protein [Anaerolineae bacterium]|nr:PLP-dependent aminotransferase family protein [Anaerolineae bacterium]HNU04396.1 PLP-dependent aminotransferase family protein [Anaerolineae bacterium]
MATPWHNRYALRTEGMGSSVIRELLKLTEQPDVISFAGGLPAPEMFPVAEFKQAADKVLTEFGARALQYGATEGYLPLRSLIVQQMARYGIQAKEDNVLLTSGSQQALDMIGRLLINPGDKVLTERPTYLGALQAWSAYQARYVTVPVDQDGLRTELLEEALRSGPKFMYILPNFQNPGGVTLSLERRMKLVQMADHYGIPLVEDDPYGQLRYSGDHLPPLVVLDCDHLESRACEAHGYFEGNVIYTSTFSKTLAPGLRLGWIVAPVDVIKRCVQAKQGMDLHTSSFVQMVAYEVAKDGFLEQHVRRIRQVYSHRRDVMLAALERHFPAEVQWTRPDGGLFLWAWLPEGMDAAELLKIAVDTQRVAFVPGHAFYPDGQGKNTMRLNFSNASPEMIEEGIRRLGLVLKGQMAGVRRAEQVIERVLA